MVPCLFLLALGANRRSLYAFRFVWRVPFPYPFGQGDECNARPLVICALPVAADGCTETNPGIMYLAWSEDRATLESDPSAEPGIVPQKPGR
jgi:hypothetical protein